MHPGFAWDVNGNLATKPSEQRTVKIAHELRGAGLTLRAIVAELKRLRRFNRARRPFNLSQVQRLLTRQPAAD